MLTKHLVVLCYHLRVDGDESSRADDGADVEAETTLSSSKLSTLPQMLSSVVGNPVPLLPHVPLINIGYVDPLQHPALRRALRTNSLRGIATTALDGLGPTSFDAALDAISDIGSAAPLLGQPTALDLIPSAIGRLTAVSSTLEAMSYMPSALPEFSSLGSLFPRHLEKLHDDLPIGGFASLASIYSSDRLLAAISAPSNAITTVLDSYSNLQERLDALMSYGGASLLGYNSELSSRLFGDVPALDIFNVALQERRIDSPKLHVRDVPAIAENIIAADRSLRNVGDDKSTGAGLSVSDYLTLFGLILTMLVYVDTKQADNQIIHELKRLNASQEADAGGGHPSTGVESVRLNDPTHATKWLAAHTPYALLLNAPIRLEPNGDAPIIASVRVDQSLHVVKQRGSWLQVSVTSHSQNVVIVGWVEKQSVRIVR